MNRYKTVDEVIRAVKNLRLKWRKNTIGRIRCQDGDCPILALYNSKLKDSYNRIYNSNWKYAADMLGIPHNIAVRIITAADISP